MKKQERLYIIKEIINGKAVGSQDALRVELKKRGITVTQATLSRDLRELGVGRISSGEETRYILQHAAESTILKPIINTQIVSMTSNESLIVIKTLPACANVVAEFIDTLNNTDIIGTLAGDNTLLVIPSSQKKCPHVLAFLKKKLVEKA
jgi:transcriptional regulator of arginine metabolism